MKNKKETYSKICSFYASDLHLVTMLLPYISKKLKNGNNIETILEKGITKDIKLLLSKINLKKEMTKKILNVNWEDFNIKENILKEYFINTIKNEEKETIFIIRGKAEYIEKINKIIDNVINSNIAYDKKIKIINCFNIEEIKENINEILEKHDKILNTSGEKNKDEIFLDQEEIFKLKKAN